MSHFRDTKIYLPAFSANTYQPVLQGSCGVQIKIDRTVKDIKLQ